MPLPQDVLPLCLVSVCSGPDGAALPSDAVRSSKLGRSKRFLLVSRRSMSSFKTQHVVQGDSLEFDPFPRASSFVHALSPFEKPHSYVRHRICPSRRLKLPKVLPCAFEARPRQAHEARPWLARPPCIRMALGWKGIGSFQGDPFEGTIVPVEKGSCPMVGQCTPHRFEPGSRS